MIASFPGILAALALLVGCVTLLAEHPRTQRFFRVPPAVLWIYLLPTAASTLGLIPRESATYDRCVQHGLPAALLLLLVAADLRAVWRLGPRALAMMLAGSAGILVACPAVVALAGGLLPDGAWAALGALSASWIGGSANMIAVKESVGLADAVLLDAVIVDAVVAYGWMALLVALAPLQARLDRWLRADAAALPALDRPHAAPRGAPAPVDARWLPALLALAAAGALLARGLATRLPAIPGAISEYTWTVLLVTALGVALSFTPAQRLAQRGATRVGTFALYVVLACIGARADLGASAGAGRLILAGAACLLAHGALLFACARALRAPLFLWATASQANVGGPVSAPVVAAAYRPQLAHVGLLLAVVGNVGGTYLGILGAQLCRRAAGGRAR